MDNPFKAKRDLMVVIANAAMPVLLDRLGGTVTVSEVELAALSERYGGAVAVRAEPVRGDQGVYRLTLVSSKLKPKGDEPVS